MRPPPFLAHHFRRKSNSLPNIKQPLPSAVVRTGRSNLTEESFTSLHDALKQ